MSKYETYAWCGKEGKEGKEGEEGEEGEEVIPIIKPKRLPPFENWTIISSDPEGDLKDLDDIDQDFRIHWIVLSQKAFSYKSDKIRVQTFFLENKLDSWFEIQSILSDRTWLFICTSQSLRIDTLKDIIAKKYHGPRKLENGFVIPGNELYRFEAILKEATTGGKT